MSDSGKTQQFSVAIELDQETSIFHLMVSGDQIVILQAMIESYEGIGTVRTIEDSQELNGDRSLIAVITPNDQVADCQRLLDSIHKEVSFEFVARQSI